MSEKVRILLLKPGCEGRAMWIAPTHEVLSGLLGGEFTMQNPLNDGTVVISREPADMEQAPSYVLRNSRGQVVSRFYGEVIVAGLFRKESELDSLSDGEIRMAMERLEVFDGE